MNTTTPQGVQQIDIDAPAQLTTYQWQDYQGKPLYYLRIKINNKEMTLNVGAKTIQRITEMAQPEKTTTEKTLDQLDEENVKKQERAKKQHQ